MFFCDYKTHAIPFFISYSLLPLDLLYFKSVSILKHDVSNNISPPQISSLFHYQHNIHSYITRSSTRGNFFLKYSRINKQNMSFSRNGVRIWNSLSSKFHQMPKTNFKRNVHNMLLQRVFRNSLRKTNILIYRIWICPEYRTYRPFPSSLKSLLQSESKCEIFVMVIRSYFNMNENWFS